MRADVEVRLLVRKRPKWKYQGIALLEQIIDPSAVIKEEHRLYCIDLDDESRYFGQIVERTDDSVTIAETLLKPDETTWFSRDEIVEMTPLDVSPMPEGLLVTLTREEILDLIAYIAANGDQNDESFKR